MSIVQNATIRNNQADSAVRPWADRAGELAAWTWANLINRTDRHGKYLPRHLRTNKNAITGGQLTRPILARHYRGRDVGDICGIHTTALDGTCRFCVWDIDNHGEFDGALRDANEQAAVGLFYRLEDAGFRPILEDSNGRGGFHVWLIFNRPTAAAGVFSFAQKMIDGNADIETFPKQPTLSGKECGNWIRLPGRHHTHNHWSKIYHRQGGWLEGAEAIIELMEGSSFE